MPAPLISRDEVVRRLFSVFRTYGYEGATLARLSEATGLGRASLYHYFPDGKEGMLRAVLAATRTWLITSIKGPLEGNGSPSERIRATMKNLAAGYNNGMVSCLVNLFGVGDAQDVAADDLRETGQAYLAGFASFLRSCGMSASAAHETALETVSQIEGALVLARALRDRTVFAKCLSRIEKQYIKIARGG